MLTINRPVLRVATSAAAVCALIDRLQVLALLPAAEASVRLHRALTTSTELRPIEFELVRSLVARVTARASCDGHFPIEILNATSITEIRNVAERVARREAARLDRRVRRVLDHIGARFATPDDVTLTALAHLAEVSPEHLCRLVRRETGQTLRAHVRQARVAQAARLLTGIAAHMAVKEIAAKVGYENAAQLCREFRRVKGVPPGRYGRAARTEYRRR